MVTRRAVLRGTAAASIGAIAAAHGATPIEAAGLDAGWGQLADGGAAGSFFKYRDAFQVAMKFNKVAAEVFVKEQLNGGVAIFFKFFLKEWTTVGVQELSQDTFPDLKSCDIYFAKVDRAGAEFFIKNEQNSLLGSIQTSTDGIFYKFQELKPNTDGEIG
jgi:hypothetical protein